MREIARQPVGRVRVRALLRRPDSLPEHDFLEKVTGSLEQLPSDLTPDAPFVLVHLAVKQFDRDGSGFEAVNVAATRELLRQLGPGARGVLYASSMSVYGQGAQEGVDEDHVPTPDMPLARSRRQAEMEIDAWSRRTHIPAFLMRPRFVIGEGDRYVMPGLFRMIGDRVRLSNGRQRYSFIDVDDYARLMLQLSEHLFQHSESGAVGAQALNVGYTRPLAFDTVARLLRQAQGLPDVRWRWPLPVVPAATRWLRHTSNQGWQQWATRLELLGLSHWGDVRALVSKVGDALVSQDPIPVFERAAHAYLAESRGDT